MKNLTLLFFSFIFSLSYATPELSSNSFTSENVNIEVTYRYKNDITDLYFSSLVKNLNDYAETLIKSGKIQRKKIYLDIMIAEWMGHDTGIRMFRYKSGYYCHINGLVQKITQDYLAKIILYFSAPDWQSFYYDEGKLKPKTALKIFNQRLENLSTSFNPSKLKAWENGGITVYFENDSLFCYNQKTKLGPIKWITPFALKNRQFIVIGETLFIYEKGSQINKMLLSKNVLTDYMEGCWTEIFPKWVNFHQPGKCFLSYSYPKNKFYML
ncbi:MAG: hypothetical protein ACKOXB_07885 [Flavobacteriales bacterium]